MIQDTVVKLIQPAAFSDPLTEVLREGARALLAQAVEAEVAAFLSGHADRQTGDGRQRLVRHGHRPERAIMTMRLTRRRPGWEMLWGERRRTGIIVARQNRRSAPCPNS